MEARSLSHLVIYITSLLQINKLHLAHKDSTQPHAWNAHQIDFREF